MAIIAAGIGVPHSPNFASTVDPNDPNSDTATYYRRIAKQLDASQLDTLVMFSTDHLNTFFLDNFPALSVGVASRTTGPNDGTPGLRPTALSVPETLASHLRACLIAEDFDAGVTHEFTLDHSWLVPLQFIRPQADLSIVPIFVNGHYLPLMSARRAWQLGRAIGQAIENWPENVRVGALGSGSFSLEVGGPRIGPDALAGVPDPEWASRIVDLLRQGDLATLVEEATAERMAGAGNVGGELLDWIGMLGVIGVRPADFVELQPQFGHGYAYWSVA